MQRRAGPPTTALPPRLMRDKPGATKVLVTILLRPPRAPAPHKVARSIFPRARSSRSPWPTGSRSPHRAEAALDRVLGMRPLSASSSGHCAGAATGPTATLARSRSLVRHRRRSPPAGCGRFRVAGEHRRLAQGTTRRGRVRQGELKAKPRCHQGHYRDAAAGMRLLGLTLAGGLCWPVTPAVTPGRVPSR
jgi:hypothetical protein